MFTPPPSPRPADVKQPLAPCPPSLTPSYDRKRRTGRHFRWAVLTVPLALILITLSTRYLAHPAAFDIFGSSSSDEWSRFSENHNGWHLHKRHPSPGADDIDNNNIPPSSVPAATLSTSAAPLNSATPIPPPSSTAPQAVPTIPSAPPTLPTPFPQAYDQHFTYNFSSSSCLAFFGNMTASSAFRQCRPFTLLSQSSSAFINAQSNFTLMNTLIWGTCNTNLGVNQCQANMDWFIQSLKQECQADLNDKNQLAVDALTAMNAFQLMYDAACMPNPSTNTYCYMEALAKPGSPDLYLYQLPYGTPLPPNVTGLTCSPCSKSVLNLYSAALSNGTTAVDLKGLKRTYDSAVQEVNQQCGNTFAVISNSATPAASSYRLINAFAVVLGIYLLII